MIRGLLCTALIFSCAELLRVGGNSVSRGRYNQEIAAGFTPATNKPASKDEWVFNGSIKNIFVPKDASHKHKNILGLNAPVDRRQFLLAKSELRFQQMIFGAGNLANFSASNLARKIHGLEDFNIRLNGCYFASQIHDSESLCRTLADVFYQHSERSLVWLKENMRIGVGQVSANLCLTYPSGFFYSFHGRGGGVSSFVQNAPSLPYGHSDQDHTNGSDNQQRNSGPSHPSLRYEIGLIAILLGIIGFRASLWGSKPDHNRWFHLSAFLGGGIIMGAGMIALIGFLAGA